MEQSLEDIGSSGRAAGAGSSAGSSTSPATRSEASGSTVYHVQVSTSGSPHGARERAMEIAERLQLPVRVVIQGGGIYILRVGETGDPEEAANLRRLAVELGYEDAKVVLR